MESRDKCAREVVPIVRTGRKWTERNVVEDTKAGKRRPWFQFGSPERHKPAPAERRKSVVTEVQNQEERMSLNCMEWNLLPPATKTMIDETSVIKGLFLGDPSHDYEHIEMSKDEEGHEAQEEEITVKIKEEQRLAAAISLIDKEAAVVPRGAYIKTPHGHVHTNRSFEGLSVSDAGKLSSYFHFAEPVHLKQKSLLEKADLDPSMDFMDSLENDIPKGSWSLQFEKGSSVLVLRSLLWGGLTFFHIPMTPQHGYIYMGTGLKNIDLPFML
ncbi:radial spoke head protein 9 homolog isoform X2 [Polyodon spathula]|uniref:radial spoke head protein 9 homolog isoform X2 n=1 Tax=Polyodon spathula TaxID=7913 RepID=UPI001B7E5FC6|nr:radial spoke head protein 9 homolog isoform X2 [Polyodon spathula]